MVDEVNAAIKGIGSTHDCYDAQLVVDKVNDYFGEKSLSEMAAAKVCTRPRMPIKGQGWVQIKIPGSLRC